MEYESGAKAAALQTLARSSMLSLVAKRLDCVCFSTLLATRVIVRELPVHRKMRSTGGGGGVKSKSDKRIDVCDDVDLSKMR